MYRTVLGDGLDGPEQQLVEVGHVQQVEAEEVAVEDRPQHRHHEQQLTNQKL